MISRINPSVSFSETSGLSTNDRGHETSVYSATMFEIPVFLSAGRIHDTFKSRGILFRPVYLVNPDDAVVRIGLIEYPSATQPPKLRESDFHKTRLFSFVDKTLLETSLSNPAKEVSLKKQSKEKDDDKDENKNVGSPVYFPIDKHRQPVFTQEKGVLPKVIHPHEDDSNPFVASAQDDWINLYLKSHEYTIHDNEGSGDCLFATIRDAFDSVHQKTTVSKLRKYLSEQATEETFLQYKTMYDTITDALKEDIAKLKQLEQTHKELHQQFATKKNNIEMTQLANEAAQIKEQHKKLRDSKRAGEQLVREWKFMKGINNLSDFKEKIQKCDFWADTWAISTLERILNIKLIILSSEYYKERDEKNVIQCGHVIDDKWGVFTPDVYMLIDFTGNHYRLIGYKSRLLFHYYEIPEKIKNLIRNRCLEKNAGIYSMIPDFKDSLGNIPNSPSHGQPLLEDNAASVYNDAIVFQYYSKSTDKPYPGKGSGETIPDADVLRFRELSLIPQWRKKLSNFWISPFELHGLHWNSVEHYYQASKYRKSNPEFFRNFALESGTELSKDPLIAKKMGGKISKIRPKNVTMDTDFFSSGRNVEEMNSAFYAKFTQDPELKEMLRQTQDAKLTHFMRGHPPIVFDGLHEVRKQINSM